MTARDVAQRAVILDELAERVDRALTEARTEVRDAMDAGDRLNITSSAGVVLGSVTMANGRVTARVVDVRAFTAWVQQHCPDEVQTTVREAFRLAVLQASRKAGEPCAPDGTLDVPGVVVAIGDPVPQIRRSDEAAAEIDRMFTAGEIDLRALIRELPAGE